MIKLCIFDFDGTLVNSLPTIAYFGNKALESVGLDEITIDKYRYLVGDGKKTLIHRMLGCFDADNEENFEKVEKEYDNAYESNTAYKSEVYEGINELLAELKSRGIRSAICSNKPHNVVCELAEQMFGGVFDAVWGLEDGANKKPAPDNALKIADSMGIKTEECLFIGDTNVDIFTAKNAKMKSVGVLWGFRDEKELTEAGADFIAGEPLDILKYTD